MKYKIIIIGIGLILGLAVLLLGFVNKPEEIIPIINPIIIEPIFGASSIAHDAGAGQRVTTQTNTVSFTVATGDDKILLAVTNFRDDGTADVSGITWNGAAESFTEVGSVSKNDIVFQLWYLVNPTSKADNVVATGTTDPHSQLISILSLTGVHQTDPVPTNAMSTTHDGNYGIAITTQHVDSWLFGGIGPRNANYAITPDYTEVFVSDTNASLFTERRALTTTAEYSLTWTGTGAADHGVGVMEIREAGVAVADEPVFQSLYDFGTD